MSLPIIIYGIIMFLAVSTAIGGLIIRAVIFSKIYGKNKDSIMLALQDKIVEKEYKRNKYQKS